VHPCHHLANLACLARSIVGGAQCVIEHDDTLRPALRLHQRFHLRVVDAPHFRFVEEIAHLGVMADEMKSVALEGEFPTSAVMEDDTTRIGLAAAAPVIRAGRTCLGEYLGAIGDDIIERRFDRLGLGIGPVGYRFQTFDRLDHGPLLRAGRCPTTDR
jgi:hypothetical protein